MIAQQQRKLEEERSGLQAEGNRIGKEVGQKIKGGADPKGEEVAELRQQGNAIKQKVAVLEEEEKHLSTQLKEQLLTYPNLPSPDCPEGKTRATTSSCAAGAAQDRRKGWRSTGRSLNDSTCSTPSDPSASPRVVLSP